jgi:hypothetical protein
MKIGEAAFIDILKDIASKNKTVIRLACKGRSKFEGWLKFEIAKKLIEKGFEVFPEKGRFDLVISNESGEDFVVELKTANTNYRIRGIENKYRPVTKNFKGIFQDIEKIKRSGKKGKVVFVIFPVPVNDERYLKFIERVQKNTGVFIIQNFQHIEDNYGIVLCESEVINSKE